MAVLSFNPLAAAARTKRILILSLFLLLGPVLPGTPGGQGEKGALKYFSNYMPLEERMQPQNWDILQDKRGMIYAANHSGLMEFDGVTWQFIDLPNYITRSLAMDEKGTIYVGGKNELGFLAPGPGGSLQYVSLMEYIDENKRNFGSVWETYSTKQGIYYWTSGFLFRWNPDHRQMKIWQPESVFSACFSCEGELYIRQGKIGLQKMAEDSPVMLPGGETFADVGIYMIAPYKPGTGKLLIGTRSQGLFIHDGTDAEPFPTAIDDYLKENKLYHGTGLVFSPGDFALATRLGGLAIMDSHGRLKEMYNKASGLQDDSVNFVFEDSRGNLWLALDKGIAKIEYASPFSIYDEKRSHLPGIILSVVRHASHKEIYAGTTNGLYLLSPSGAFRPVPGIPGACWSLLPAGDSILAATRHGVFQVRKNTVRRIIEGPSYILSRSRFHKNRIRVGTNRGLTSLSLTGDEWAEEYTFEQISTQVRSIAEDEKGNLWLGTLTGNALEVSFPDPGTTRDAVVTAYGTAEGLPPGEIHVVAAGGHVMFATDKGLFRFHRTKAAFIPDHTFGGEFAGGPGARGVFRIAEDRNKNIYFHSKRRNFQAICQPDGTFIIHAKPFLRIPKAQVNRIYPDPDGVTAWFASHNNLVRCDTRVKKNYRRDYPVFIRRVLTGGKTVFAGTRSDKKNEKPVPVFSWNDRNPRFVFAAPFFEAETETLYRFLLQGYDKDWSAWTRETQKDYTNLDPGFYSFRVRAKNVYETISREDTFPFRVLPPWYRTWWAYLLYLFLLLMGVYFIVKWRSRKLVREKQKLEQIIKERTREINEQKQQLEEQSEKLKEMDKIKSRFFANISHEFRTPLTLIMGPLEQVLSEHKDSDLENNINLALRNSQRLLTLINQLLDLSKLDSGKMKLKAVPQDVIPFLKGVVSSFESLATQEKLDLEIHLEEEIILYFDPGKLEKVMVNLVANAIKFTPAGGKVSVSAAANPTKEKNYPYGYLEIKVCDTGVGIPEDQLPYIFDRFYQAEGVFTHEHKHKGSGIGLALVKELVELHHGCIVVQSTEGKGTEFTIRLPSGSAHLKPENILTQPPTTAKTVPLIGRGCQPPPAKTFDYLENHEPPAEKKEVRPGEPDIKEKDVILVVEDNAEVRRYIRGPLETLYTVKEAVNGKDGIEKARQIVPALVVSDVMMPEIDGYELCKVLKTDVVTSHIPIILLTAKASEESIVEGLETGADDYITKPFNTKILLTRIKNLIDLRRQLQEKIQREMVLQPTEIPVSSIDQTFMKELKAAIEKNLSDPDFCVDDLAKALYMARSTLNLKIRALTGESTNQFIQSYRLKRAAQLLKADFGNVTEVAFEVGFSSSSYFTRCFKEKFHRLPSDFQVSEAG